MQMYKQINKQTNRISFIIIMTKVISSTPSLLDKPTAPLLRFWSDPAVMLLKKKQVLNLYPVLYPKQIGLKDFVVSHEIHLFDFIKINIKFREVLLTNQRSCPFTTLSLLHSLMLYKGKNKQATQMTSNDFFNKAKYTNSYYYVTER